MIEDLDFSMRVRKIDGIVGYGETTLADPDLTYVVGGTLARGGFYFKKCGRPPLLVVSNLDYGSAKRSGRVKRVQTLTQWGYEKLQKEYAGRDEASPRLVAKILRKEGISGRVVLFGRNDLAKALRFAQTLRRLGAQLVGERPPTVVETARDTKERHELESLRDVGKRTAKIVDRLLQSLHNATTKRGHLQVGEKRATIGLIKSHVASMLAAEGLSAPEGTIFAVGASGADPHNAGDPRAEIKKGRLIVFDIFPQAENGYWSDLTRTFVLGRADSKAREMFETVRQAQGDAIDHLRAGVTGETSMNRACDVIERAGFETVRGLYTGTEKRITSGFIHSLGHGVGLTIGESPYLSFNSRAPLKAGEVVTVEPGVYIPGYGGVRIEDTVLIKSKGIEILTPIEKELELS
ncbi:MAG TPA: Xaa-Pro peptidase family protein [archaeon]|nr:Xaa-Pro peptidase family protein [archaeon]